MAARTSKEDVNIKFGANIVISNNFAKSRDEVTLSRYLPPNRVVAKDPVSDNRLALTKLAVRSVQNRYIGCAGMIVKNATLPVVSWSRIRPGKNLQIQNIIDDTAELKNAARVTGGTRLISNALASAMGSGVERYG